MPDLCRTGSGRAFFAGVEKKSTKQESDFVSLHFATVRLQRKRIKNKRPGTSRCGFILKVASTSWMWDFGNISNSITLQFSPLKTRTNTALLVVRVHAIIDARA